MIEPPTRRQVGPQLPSGQLTLSLNKGLGDQIRDFSKVVGRRLDYVHRSLAAQLFTAVIYDTPVDTSQARSSWWPSKNAPVMGGGLRSDGGAAALREVVDVTRDAKLSEVLFLMNNTPYIVPLEYGWSNKSPEGMVRINVQRMQTHIREVAATARELR